MFALFGWHVVHYHADGVLYRASQGTPYGTVSARLDALTNKRTFVSRFKYASRPAIEYMFQGTVVPLSIVPRNGVARDRCDQAIKDGASFTNALRASRVSALIKALDERFWSDFDDMRSECTASVELSDDTGDELGGGESDTSMLSSLRTVPLEGPC